MHFIKAFYKNSECIVLKINVMFILEEKGIFIRKGSVTKITWLSRTKDKILFSTGRGKVESAANITL